MSIKEVNISKGVQGLLVFSMWTITSFLCHYTGKQFLNSTGLTQNGSLKALFLTIVQMFMCYCLTDVKIRYDRIFAAMTITHFMATLSTNVSMGLMFASSTFAIKLLEPVTSAVVQRIVLSIPLHPSLFISLPLIIGGAGIFTGNPLTSHTFTVGTMMAFLSNVILAFRNVAIKMDQSKSTGMMFASTTSILIVVMCHLVMLPLLYLLEARSILGLGTTTVVIYASLSSIFHVTYSYISTNIVLKFMTVLSHSITNILKRVLVVILLYSFGHRHASMSNFLGLLVSTVGLFIYVGFKRNQNTPKENQQMKATPQDKRVYIKVAAFFVALVCCGVIGISYSPNFTTAGVPSDFQSLADFESRSFGGNSFQIMSKRELQPDVDSGKFANKTEIKRFLGAQLSRNPQDTDILSPQLETNIEIIREAQRIHFNLFKDLIGHFKYAMLFDVAAFENKGDPAITSGEVFLLRRLGIDIIYYCNFFQCKDNNLVYAKNMSDIYTKEELVILIHGGGNIVGYALNDVLKFQILRLFQGFKIVIFSQSIYLRSDKGRHLESCKQNYCCNKNLTLILRDRQSLEMARKYFNNGTNLVMAPDMAFQIGPVKRFMAPMYDILWLKRKDSETPHYQIPNLPSDITVKVRDWWGWMTPKGDNSMENAFLIATNGMLFLQRGRVVITDRLHGHILCTLLNIPHVLIDNRFKKLSSYHNTWTRSLQNTMITTDANDAVQMALKLLEKYKHDIPPIAPFMEVNEHPYEDSRGRPITPTLPFEFTKKKNLKVK